MCNIRLLTFARTQPQLFEDTVRHMVHDNGVRGCMCHKSESRVQARLTEHGHHGVDGVVADIVVDVELAPPRFPGQEGSIGHDDAADVRRHILRFSESLRFQIRNHVQHWKSTNDGNIKRQGRRCSPAHCMNYAPPCLTRRSTAEDNMDPRVCIVMTRIL